MMYFFIGLGVMSGLVLFGFLPMALYISQNRKDNYDE